MTARSIIRFTSAVPAKDTLCVATLSWNGRHLYLVPKLSTFLYLASEDQAGVRQFAQDVWCFFDQHPIEEVFVCRGPSTGSEQWSHGSVRMETVLQMLPITCAYAHVQKIAGRSGRENWLMPLPQAHLNAIEQKLQSRAIKTAAFRIADHLDHLRPDAASARK